MFLSSTAVRTPCQAAALPEQCHDELTAGISGLLLPHAQVTRSLQTLQALQRTRGSKEGVSASSWNCPFPAAGLEGRDREMMYLDAIVRLQYLAWAEQAVMPSVSSRPCKSTRKWLTWLTSS